MFFTFCMRRNDGDQAAAKHLDNEARLELYEDECMAAVETDPGRQPHARVDRLEEHEVALARECRLREVQMWTMIREALACLCFLVTLFVFTYMNVDPNGFRQVNHLRQFLLDKRSEGNDFGQVCIRLPLRRVHSILENIDRHDR